MNLRIYIGYIVLMLLSVNNWAQLSEKSKVYLITCDEGDAVYEQFGHTALHIEDPSSGNDIVFNWGVFNYSEDFEMKFAKGKLDYLMGMQNPQGFLSSYLAYGPYKERGVRELELNMNLAQKNKLWSALQENAKEENRGYRYDFFYKNCATIIRDHIANAMQADLKYGKHPESDTRTFRQIIDEGFQDLPWTSFGIDLVLASPIDIKVNNENMMFNPLKMETIFKTSEVLVDGKWVSFAINERTVLKGEPRSNENQLWFTPTLLSILILIITMVIGFFQWEKGLRIWGGFLFLLLSILGILLLIMWTSTDHQTAKYNWNLLWTHPLLLVLLVSVSFKKIHLLFEKVYLILAMLMFALVLFFLMLPQEFHTASRIIIMALAFEYYFLHKQVGRFKRIT